MLWLLPSCGGWLLACTRAHAAEPHEARIQSLGSQTQVQYPTLEDALAAAVNGDRITLNQAYDTCNKNIMIDDGRSLTLCLAGQTYTGTITLGDPDDSSKSGRLTIVNGLETATITGAISCYSNSELTIQGLEGLADALVINSSLTRDTDSRVNVKGATFSKGSAWESYISEGCGSTESGGTFTVALYAAGIGDTYYTSLEAALAAAGDGETVKMFRQNENRQLFITSLRKNNLGGRGLWL